MKYGRFHEIQWIHLAMKSGSQMSQGPMVLFLNNYSGHIIPLDPPDTLLKLFQSIKSRSPNSLNLLFFSLVRHTSDEKPRKGSFLTSP